MNISFLHSYKIIYYSIFVTALPLQAIDSAQLHRHFKTIRKYIRQIIQEWTK